MGPYISSLAACSAGSSGLGAGLLSKDVADVESGASDASFGAVVDDVNRVAIIPDIGLNIWAQLANSLSSFSQSSLDMPDGLSGRVARIPD